MNIVILFGGCSSEYGVSLQSANGVLRHIDRSRFTPIPVGISPAGDWYYFSGDLAKIACDDWFNAADCALAALSANRSDRALLVFRKSGVERIAVDAVFPVLHGKNGEDGTIQGLCELAGLPLVGCGTLASALCMDKDRAHKLVSLAGIRVPRSFTLERGYDADQAMAQAEAIGYPLFIKPVRAGSSHGITRVTERGGLLGAVRDALRYDNRVIAEEGILGFEVGCAVMGNEALITGELDEIALAGGFFDFTEKYQLISAKIHVPARVEPRVAEALKDAAKTVYRALDCRGFARVDMFLTPSGEIVFNEVNTIPGFTPHSRFPGMMRAAGIGFSQVITKAVELAMEA